MNTTSPMGLAPAQAFTSQHALEGMSWFFGTSHVMQQLRHEIKTHEGATTPVFLHGEKGVGKTFVAQLLHNMSGLEGNFVVFDVLSIAPVQLEAELAHAMQNTARHGKSGTLFIVGVESLPLFFQKMLLQHYQSCAHGEAVLPAPRLVCASQQDVTGLIESGLFSEKLYQIFQDAVLNVPSLAQRPEDISSIAQYMARQYSQNYGSQKKLGKEALKALTDATWSGNVRQMTSTIQQAIAHSDRNMLGKEDVQPYLPEASSSGLGAFVCLPDAAENCLARYFDSLQGMAPAPDLYDRIMGEVEKPLLAHVLRYVRGNQLRASEVLGINRNTLRKKIRYWQIDAKNLDHE